MKITGASVTDLRRSEGFIAAPYLVVHVDEEPSITGETIVSSSPGPQLKFVQHGPFWHIEPSSVGTISEEEVAGYANSSNPTRNGNKLVPCEVSVDNVSVGSMFMQIDRARQLLRKNQTGYTYTVSDVAARRGRIQWDLELAHPMCMYWLGESVCGEDRINETIQLHATKMPACRDHIGLLRYEAKNLRLQRTGRTR